MLPSDAAVRGEQGELWLWLVFRHESVSLHDVLGRGRGACKLARLRPGANWLAIKLDSLGDPARDRPQQEDAHTTHNHGECYSCVVCCSSTNYDCSMASAEASVCGRLSRSVDVLVSRSVPHCRSASRSEGVHTFSSSRFRAAPGCSKPSRVVLRNCLTQSDLLSRRIDGVSARVAAHHSPESELATLPSPHLLQLSRLCRIAHAPS